MKQYTKNLTFKSFMTLFALAIVQTSLWAQENSGGAASESSSGSTTTTKISSTTGTGEWYASPWVWVIGASLFILLLVALLRGKSSSSGDTVASRTDRVTVTKSTDTNV